MAGEEFLDSTLFELERKNIKVGYNAAIIHLREHGYNQAAMFLEISNIDIAIDDVQRKKQDTAA